MKTLYLNLLFYTACCLLLFSSCEIKDNTPCAAQYTYHHLTAEEKSKTPYFNNPNFDTISFASSTGDTLTFALQRIDSSWYIEDMNRNPNPDGCPDWHYYENRLVTYKSINTNDIIKVSHNLKTAIHGNDAVIFQFNSTNFFMWGNWIGSPTYTTYKAEDKQYNRTYLASILIYSNSSDTSSSKILYNIEYATYFINDKGQNKTYHLIFP